jgi:hypothetical protein
VNQAGTDGVLDDVPNDRFELLFSSEEVVVEASLPEGSVDATPPGCALRQVLELADEGHDVAGGGCLEDQVHMVGHDAVGIDEHAGLASMRLEHVDRIGGDVAMGEMGRRSSTATVMEQRLPDRA